MADTGTSWFFKHNNIANFSWSDRFIFPFFSQPETSFFLRKRLHMLSVKKKYKLWEKEKNKVLLRCDHSSIALEALLLI